MEKSESIVKLAAALSKFQGEVKNPPNSANNPFFKSKYAPLDVVINTIKPVLAKYGLSYIQMPGGDGEHVTCSTILMCEGEWLESDVLVLKADKITAQGAGGAITYARRYQLTAILGLAGEEDDDGNAATYGDKGFTKNTSKPLSNSKPPYKAPQPTENTTGILNDKQIQRLYSIAHAAGIDHPTVLTHILAKFKAKSTTELSKSQYDEMCTGYEKMKKGTK